MMILYEYACIDCGVSQEFLEEAKDWGLYVEDTHDCPACGGVMVFLYPTLGFMFRKSEVQ